MLSWLEMMDSSHVVMVGDVVAEGGLRVALGAIYIYIYMSWRHWIATSCIVFWLLVFEVLPLVLEPISLK